jgi:hypothetical protein
VRLLRSRRRAALELRARRRDPERRERAERVERAHQRAYHVDADGSGGRGGRRGGRSGCWRRRGVVGARLGRGRARGLIGRCLRLGLSARDRRLRASKRVGVGCAVGGGRRVGRGLVGGRLAVELGGGRALGLCADRRQRPAHASEQLAERAARRVGRRAAAGWHERVKALRSHQEGKGGGHALGGPATRGGAGVVLRAQPRERARRRRDVREESGRDELGAERGEALRG